MSHFIIICVLRCIVESRTLHRNWKLIMIWKIHYDWTATHMTYNRSGEIVDVYALIESTMVDQSLVVSMGIWIFIDRLRILRWPICRGGGTRSMHLWGSWRAGMS